MNIAHFIAGIFLSIAAVFGGSPQTQAPLAGTVYPVGANQFYLSGAGVTSSASTMQLTSFKTPDGRNLTMSMFGSIGYGALEPGTSKLEDITFTGISQNANGTATLTGVTRGNDFVTPYAASTTLAKAHAGGATFILTNTAGFYTQFYSLNNVATSTNTLVFSSTTPPVYDADPIWANFSTQVLADVAYVNSVVAGGAANASETVKGIIELATGAESSAGTSLGATGARLVVPNSLATSTPYSGTPTGSFPTSASIGGKLSQTWLDLTAAFTWSGLHTFTAGLLTTASSTLNATTTIAASNVNSKALILNGVATQWPSSQGVANSVLSNNGSGVLSWASSGPVSSYVGTTVATSSTDTTATVYNLDTTFTTTFQPTTITIYYLLQGRTGSGTVATSTGVATYSGASLVSNSWLQKNATPISTLNPVIDAGAPSSGDGSTNLQYNISITSVTSTQFVVRIQHNGGSTFGGGNASFYPVAYR